MDRKLTSFLLLCGFFGALFFTIVAVTVSFLYTESSFAVTLLSELGGVNSPFSNYMNFLGILPLGVFMMLFSFGLSKTNLPKKTSGVIAENLFFAMGIFLSLMAFFPCGENCGRDSFIAGPHQFLSGVGIAFGLFAMAFLAYHFYEYHSIKHYKFWSELFFISGIVSATLGGYYALVEPFYSGILQKIAVVIPLTIVSLFSVRIHHAIRHRGIKID